MKPHPKPHPPEMVTQHGRWRFCSACWRAVETNGKPTTCAAYLLTAGWPERAEKKRG